MLHPVGEWLPWCHFIPGMVGPDASAMSLTTLMASKGRAVIAGVERDGGKTTLLGAVTSATLLDHFIGGS